MKAYQNFYYIIYAKIAFVNPFMTFYIVNFVIFALFLHSLRHFMNNFAPLLAFCGAK